MRPERSPDSQPGRQFLSRRDARLLGAAAVSLALLVTASIWEWLDGGGGEEALRRLAGYGYAGVFLIMLFSSATILVPVPGLAVVIAAGGLLNPLVLGPLVGLGSACGELTGYFAGYGGAAAIGHEEGIAWAKTRIGKYGFWGLFLLAAIPFPFDLAGLAAGILRYPIGKFFLATGLGNTVKATVLATFGKGLLGLLPWM